MAMRDFPAGWAYQDAVAEAGDLHDRVRCLEDAVKHAINRLDGNIERRKVADDLRAALVAGPPLRSDVDDE